VGKYAYIDTTGKIAIAPQFDQAGEFSEGMAAVQVEGKSDYKYGYIDKTGRFAIPPQFDYACRFRGHLAAVSINRKWGFIDRMGKFVITPQFDDVWGCGIQPLGSG
jgi:hypothetical protein